ncbi:cation:proton antiporter [Candidatus Woesearchaeota archaeon]|nr:cation:proton antiporter [Candidatus Woesearchaeota archaeon]
MEGIFFVAVIILIALGVSIIMRILKQPLIIGYIITGIIVNLLGVVHFESVLDIFSQIGIAFLLFIVGLHLNPKIIQELGFVSLITGLGQILLTAVGGFLICYVFGFSIVFSIYAAIAVAFSSTIIVMKFLSDKNELDTVSGRIMTGVLLVQDLVAVMVMMIMPSITGDSQVSELLLGPVIKGAGLIALIFIIGYFVFPKLEKMIAKSQEFLFLFSISWCFAVGALFEYIGFSVEIGALLAGVSLSMLPSHYEISARIKPLRDFFLILFFVVLGTKIDFSSINNIGLMIVLSVFVLFFKPLFITLITGILGYTKRNCFLSGISLGQISEFSMIIFALGYKLGHLQIHDISLISSVALITMTFSSYMIKYNAQLYKTLGKVWPHIEKKGKKQDEQDKPVVQYDMILFGYNRIGFDLLESFKRLKKKNYIVVDFNPDVVTELLKKEIECKYGDAQDEDFLDTLNLENVKMVISTVPDFETNCVLIRKVRGSSSKAIIITVSSQLDEAFTLYELGATYVLTPQFLGGKYVAEMIEQYGLDTTKFLNERKKHILHLHKRKELGIKNPHGKNHYFSV